NARKVVQQSLQQTKQNNQKWFVRINDFDTHLYLDDLAAVMPYRPDGIVLPKVNGQKDITRLDYYLQALEATHNIEQNSTLVVGIATENAASVLSLNTFNDQAPERLYGLMWGGEDLAGSLDRKSTRLNSSHVSISYAVFCLN